MTINRRELLHLCGLTAGAGLIGSLVPSARARGGNRVGPPRRLLIVFAVGGWDTSYALDPKTPDHVDVPDGAVQWFEQLDVFTDPSRPGVTDYFTRHAATTAIVRGIAVDAINHDECQRRIATGTREETRPDLGAMVAHDRGNDLPLPYLILGQLAFAGPYASSTGRVGANNQIVDLLGHGVTGETGPGGTVTGGAHHAPTVAEDNLIRAYQAAGVERARATRGATGSNRRRLDDFTTSLDRATRLRALHDRFGARGETRSLEAQVYLAVDALERDLSHAVMLTTAREWDTHGDNVRQAGHHDTTFAALTTLVDELHARPGRAAGTKMIDDTVVLVVSEMSRSPRLSGGDPAHLGKDHWPVTAAMVIGGGVAGGRVYGATAPDAQALAIDLASGAATPGGVKLLYTHFAAGVLRLCGVDPASHLGDVAVLDAFIA